MVVISPTISTIVAGQSVTYNITGSQTGILYSLRDNTDNLNVGTSGFGSGASITLVSDPFTTVGTYTINVKATSFSGSNCQSISSATVFVTALLPVTLLKFEGKYDRAIAKLHWSTSSEQNLAMFELQKSYTGNNFTKVASVNAAGTSQLITDYAYNDANLSGSVIYYRLKIIDKDNRNITYSKVIKLNVDKGIVLNNISPNPFINEINIKLEIAKDAPLIISLSDMSGRRIRTFNYSAKKGGNNISLAGLNSLLSGTYLVELIADGENISRQLLIKQ